MPLPTNFDNADDQWDTHPAAHNDANAVVNTLESDLEEHEGHADLMFMSITLFQTLNGFAYNAVWPAAFTLRHGIAQIRTTDNAPYGGSQWAPGEDPTSKSLITIDLSAAPNHPPTRFPAGHLMAWDATATAASQLAVVFRPGATNAYRARFPIAPGSEQDWGVDPAHLLGVSEDTRLQLNLCWQIQTSS